MLSAELVAPGSVPGIVPAPPVDGCAVLGALAPPPPQATMLPNKDIITSIFTHEVKRLGGRLNKAVLLKITLSKCYKFKTQRSAGSIKTYILYLCNR